MVLYFQKESSVKGSNLLSMYIRAFPADPHLLGVPVFPVRHTSVALPLLTIRGKTDPHNRDCRDPHKNNCFLCDSSLFCGYGAYVLVV